jgi:hypothetical protein
MGYALGTSACIGCGRIFSYNPMRVPSFTPPGGTREPICEQCFNNINDKRADKGLPPFSRHPDAYEPCDEEELS